MMRTLILMIAATSGLAAALLTFSETDDGRAEAVTVTPQPEVAMQEVLVASVVIEPGHTVSAENMNWQSWPEAAIHAGFVTRSAHPDAIDEFSGTIMRSRLLAGEPIRPDRLTPGNASFMSALLPPGKRAVAVKVSAESSAGGFILPNDRVDVLLTRHEEGRGRASSRTILRNVKVLAIDQLVDGAESDALVGRTATLELDVEQTESITAAEASGMLSLALRSIADTDEPDPQEPEIMPSRPDPERAPITVRIRRAGAVETVTLP